MLISLLTIVVVVWLTVKSVGLLFRLTWGVARVVAGILTAVALPTLVICVVFVGGAALIIPVALVAAAFGIAKACV